MKIEDWFSPIPGKDFNAIELLYNRLDGMYPNRWRQSFADSKAVTNWQEAWVEAFIDEGICPQVLKRGLANCRLMYDYPPSLTQFLKACHEKSRHEKPDFDAPRLENKYTPAAPEEAAKHIARINAMIAKNGGVFKSATDGLSQ